ncbi:MAG: TerC family protein [Tumebacillaceae bacterium]
MYFVKEVVSIEIAQQIVVVLNLVFVNLILSGDNAMVIALASRNLPAPLRKKAMYIGGGAAVALRIVLTIAAAYLLKIPLLSAVGGIVLAWIALQFLLAEEEGGNIKSGDGLRSAVLTILAADIAMSVDNVIAIAGVADGNVPLLVIGLVLSVPLVLWGAQMMVWLLQKVPLLIYIGAMILSWTAGKILVEDHIVQTYVIRSATMLDWLVPLVMALATVTIGWWSRRRARAAGKSHTAAIEEETEWSISSNEL